MGHLPTVRTSGRRDEKRVRARIRRQTHLHAPPVTAINLTTLEARIDELVRSVNELTEENRALRDQQGNLMAERAALIEKSELARSRVEAMIARLKAMEINS